jgi:hypothetical protein
MHLPRALVGPFAGTLIALSAAGCSSSSAGTLIGGPQGGDAGSDVGGGQEAGGTNEGGGGVGNPCDPNTPCPAPLMCCPVGGQPREGGVFTACANPRGTPPKCP